MDKLIYQPGDDHGNAIGSFGTISTNSHDSIDSIVWHDYYSYPD